VLNRLVDGVTNLIGDHGVPAVFLLMVIESACLPVPSEVIMLFAGYLVSLHSMSLTEAVAAGGRCSSGTAATCTSRPRASTWPIAGSSGAASASC
jgi:membrane protein YqaA with SNARE-associated domain